jgi:integrase
MGRPLKGPILIGDTYYARLTVPPKDRVRAGTARLHRSLGKSLTEAWQRWPEALLGLRRELDERLSLPLSDHALIRARLNSGYTVGIEMPDNEELTTHDKAALALNVLRLDLSNELHGEVYKAIEHDSSLVTWDDLIDNHSRLKQRKIGKPLAPATLVKLRATVSAFSSICSYPNTLTKDHVKQYINQLEEAQAKPVTINNKCAMLQAIVSSAIKSELTTLTVNPFTLIDFSGVSNIEDSRRAFDLTTELPQLLSTQYGEVFRLLVGTGLRIGELLSRNLNEDLQKDMLVIRPNPLINWQPKTRSSIRRVPLDARAIDAIKSTYTEGCSYRTWQDRLSNEIRKLFSDKRLVVHSCRHTFKTLTRVVGMDHAVSDAISGHMKQTVSQTSDGYGFYPDSTLIEANSKVWSVLS